MQQAARAPRSARRVELYRYISDRNQDLLGSQELIVKARNQVSTLSDRSGAGRVESGGKNDDRIVAVAKQDGLGGKMLQTNFKIHETQPSKYICGPGILI